MEKLGTRSCSSTEQFNEGDLVCGSKGEVISVSKVTQKARVRFEIDGTTSNLNLKWLSKHLTTDQQKLLYTG